jgi:hypothetical protein
MSTNIEAQSKVAESHRRLDGAPPTHLFVRLCSPEPRSLGSACWPLRQTAVPPALPTVEVPHAQLSSLNPSNFVVEKRPNPRQRSLKSAGLAGNTVVFQAESHHRAADAERPLRRRWPACPQRDPGVTAPSPSARLID